LKCWILIHNPEKSAHWPFCEMKTFL
jgi:hypothetical protein